jgi:hypothetical protein
VPDFAGLPLSSSVLWSGLVVGLGLRIGVRIWVIIETRINQNNADAVGQIQYERSKKDRIELKKIKMR